MRDFEISLVNFSLTCLEKSFDWLSDREISSLTMTPAFTRDEQKKFFIDIPRRFGYHIWGVALNDGELIGAAGLKNPKEDSVEYWGYIGEKEYWGMGLGSKMVQLVEQKAYGLGFKNIRLTVSEDNLRAISLYRRLNYIQEQIEDVYVGNARRRIIRMTKDIV